MDISLTFNFEKYIDSSPTFEKKVWTVQQTLNLKEWTVHQPLKRMDNLAIVLWHIISIYNNTQWVLVRIYLNTIETFTHKDVTTIS